MINDAVNLYGYYGQTHAASAGGCLQGLIPDRIPGTGISERRPAVLILPGGGYHHISPRESEPVALHFAAKGWAAFVLRYSCAPERFPVQLREAAMAIRYIRENGQRLGVDPEKVACLGFSAGGHLCGMLGTLYDSAWVSDLGTPEQLRPNALALCYPVTVSEGKAHWGSFENLCGNDGALRRQLSLDRLIRPDMPPVFLWHTRNDASVPCAGTLLLAQALEAAGVEFAMHIYRRGKHGLATADLLSNPAEDLQEMSPDAAGWIDLCLAFFEETGLTISVREV